MEPASDQMTTRFPAPWRILERTGCFIVQDATGHGIAWFYYRDDARGRAVGCCAVQGGSPAKGCEVRGPATWQGKTMNWGAPAIITRIGAVTLSTSARPCRRRLRVLAPYAHRSKNLEVLMSILCFKGGWATNAIALMLTAFLTLKKHAG